MTLNIADYSLFLFISVCLMLPVPFVFKHVYFGLPYASAAVANSVTVFARYFCGDHLPSHAIILTIGGDKR